jgi:hypothetical protein
MEGAKVSLFDDVDMRALEAVALERMQLAIRRSIALHALKVVITPEVMVDQLLNEMVLEMHTSIATQKVKTLEVKYPDGWWEAFRERWAPAWWIKRHPIRYKRATLDAFALYPEISLGPDGKNRVIMLRKT